MKAPRTDVPCALGERVIATREATRDLWGSETVERVLATVPREVRDVFARSSAIPKWVPETSFMAWMDALYDGPCARSTDQLARWVDRLTDRGFGTARRMVLALASPWVLLRRTDALWHTEHTHGALVAVRLSPTSARFELRDHPFTTTAVARDAISEAFRYLIYRCRVRRARETHRLLDDGALGVTVEWA